jgi:hypothetical protein
MSCKDSNRLGLERFGVSFLKFMQFVTQALSTCDTILVRIPYQEMILFIRSPLAHFHHT